MEVMVEFINVSKIYKTGSQEIKANDDVNFKILKGEFCVIVGPSGAGKTTVLNLLGGMDSPTKGEIFVDKKDISKMNLKELTNFRRYDVGFIFQFYNLMPQLTAIDNVEIATELSKNSLKSEDVLCQVGLNDRMGNFPSQLSGGEQQRVSIARAIAKNPKILLCDEPTGALDIETGKKILKLLHDTCKNHGKTIVLVTHNYAITEIADRVIHVKNGKIETDLVNENPKSIEEIEW